MGDPPLIQQTMVAFCAAVNVPPSGMAPEFTWLFMLADLALICAWLVNGPPLLPLPEAWQPLPVAQRVWISGCTLAAKVEVTPVQVGSVGGVEGGSKPEFLLQPIWLPATSSTASTKRVKVACFILCWFDFLSNVFTTGSVAIEQSFAVILVPNILKMDHAALVVKRLTYYKTLGEQTFTQLSDADYFYRPSPESNSIAIIIQHLYGNMMSRFSNFLTEDGEKAWRKRDAEFEPQDVTAKDLMDFWDTGWSTVFATIAALTPADMNKVVTIRGEELLVFDALLRQLAHYPYHIGQILYIAKMLKDAEWKNLSMPKLAKV